MMRAFGFTRILTTGAPAPLASVQVNDAVTDAPATLYTDEDNDTLKSNPFTADANGYWFFYAANGRYDVTITPVDDTGDAYTLPDVQLYDTGDV